MVTLYQLAEMAEPGEQIRWKAEKGKYERPKPRTIERIVLEEGRITIEAKGPREGRARFYVTDDGSSEAFFGEDDQSMGPVEKAELVDRDIFTEPWGE